MTGGIFLIHRNPDFPDPRWITGTNRRVGDYRKIWNNTTGEVGGEEREKNKGRAVTFSLCFNLYFK